MFSTPAWLFALTALLIPLALHLWSRRPRRVVRVGTVRHLGGLPEARARSARLADPLLLLLRLLILAAIVVGLAGPRLRGTGAGLPDHLVLVSPEFLGTAWLDSLGGTRVRLIAPGLPDVRLTRETRAAWAPALPLWEALAAADRMVARGGTIDVYARPRLSALGAVRPAMRVTVRWHLPAAAPRHQWIADLSRTPGDSIQALIGDGDATSISYQRIRTTTPNALPLPASAPPRATASRRLSLRASASPGEPLTPSQAARLSAATRAVSEALGQQVSITTEEARADTTITLPAPLIESEALADALLERWPWRPLASDSLDPREVSQAEAMPDAAAPASDPGPAPRTRELLLLAALLLLVERWLAGRPRRSPA